MIPRPMPFHERDQEKNREPKPKSLREVPGYLKKIVGQFFFRLFYIIKIVWETKPSIMFVMVFMAIFNGVTPIIGAYIWANILNSLSDAYTQITTGGVNLFVSVMTWLIVSFSFNFISGIVDRISEIFMKIASELVVNNVKVKIMKKSEEIDISSFDRPEFYEKLENANREAGYRPISILESNFRIISTIISMASFVVILFGISPVAPLLVILVSIPSAVINFIYRKKNFKYIRSRSKDRRQMNYYSSLLTDKDMVKELRIFGLSDMFIGKYRKVFDDYFSGLKKLFIGEGLFHIGITLLSTAVNCALFIFIAKGVCSGAYKIGDYSLYTGALTTISSGIATLITTTASIYEGTLFIDNMITFMDEKPTVVPLLPDPREVGRHCGHTIELCGVSFRYPGTERDVIKDLSLTIDPGDTVVLVGLNGAGKTTLIKLLTRLYDPTEGKILLDGHDIREYDTAELYKIFGIIFQDFGRYAVNVTENIAFGDLSREVNAGEIRDAAEKSSADEFIRKLPGGYETALMRIFESDGIELSVGQWQKLSVARAFYADSDIVILDEPTASLDALAEQEIYSQFDRLRADKTTIFVSHRLSSAMTANKIVVLDGGSITEQGTHSELMARRGTYYELFSVQAKRYIDGKSTDAGESVSSSEQRPRPPRGTAPVRGQTKAF